MKRKDGKAKAWRGFFHKGPMYCWWIALILLALPLTGHAEKPNNNALKIGIQGYHDFSQVP